MEEGNSMVLISRTNELLSRQTGKKIITPRVHSLEVRETMNSSVIMNKINDLMTD